MGGFRPYKTYFSRPGLWASLACLCLISSSAAQDAQSPAQPAAAQDAAARAKALVDQLKDPSPEARYAAELELAKAGPEAVAPMVEAAVRDSSRMRKMTARVGKLGPKALPPLIELAQSPDAEIRTVAGQILFQVADPSGAEHLPILLDCARRSESLQSCGRALAKVASPKAAAQAPRLIEALKGADKDLRVFAAAALGQMGAKAPGALAALSEALKDPEPAVRMSAASALGRMGRGALAALPALQAAQSDSNNDVRIEVVQAIRELKGGKPLGERPSRRGAPKAAPSAQPKAGGGGKRAP